MLPFKTIRSPSYNTIKKAVVDLRQLDNLLEKRDFTAIVKSISLLTQLYFLTFVKEDLKSYGSIKTTLKNREFTITVPHWDLSEIESTLQFIQKGVLQSSTNDEITTIYLKSQTCNSTHYCLYLEGKKSQTLKIQPFSSISEIHKDRYHKLIQPILQKMFEKIGFYCETGKTQVSVVHNSTVTGKEEVEYITIEKESLRHFKLPILPKIMPEHPPMDSLFYEAYQKKEDCDFTLVGNDGEISVHKMILKARGGDMLKGMLQQKLREANEGKVLLNGKQLQDAGNTEDMPPETGFSIEVLKLFADYLYLGPDKLIRSIEDKDNFEIFELLRLANYLQLQGMIDVCTNLIAKIATVDVKDSIRNAAEHYNNDHLKKLSAHLETQAKKET